MIVNDLIYSLFILLAKSYKQTHVFINAYQRSELSPYRYVSDEISLPGRQGHSNAVLVAWIRLHRRNPHRV